MKKNAASLAAALCAALALAAAAGAATISDVQAEGYSVGVARTYNAGACTVYAISGWGVDVTADTCDPGFQAQIDSLADPVAQCNRVWQFKHPDQHDALALLDQHGYAVSGDQCADAYTVQDASSGAVVYSGSAAGLPAVAASLPDLTHVSQTAGADVPTGAATVGGPVVQTCLPLCPTATVTAPATPSAPATTAQPVAEPSVTDAPAEAALTEATAAGDDPALAALAARSAGMNALYDL